MVDKMLLSYVNQMYILESELYSLCQIKSSLENERTVQMNRIQDEKFSYSLPRHSNTNIGEYVKGTLVLFLGILVVGGGYVQPEEMAKIVIYIIGGYILLSGIAILGGAVSEDLADSKRQQDMIEKEEARQKKILRENNKIRINCKKLTEGIQVIDAHIKEKNSILQKLYSYNIIHKNYRNFYGISITVTVHELGHLIAYMDYREREEIVISDVGTLLFLFFPIGGYVGVRYADLLKKKEQIQGLAAGLEMNIATIGLILILRNLNPYCDILSPVILYSLPTIIFNSLPINGTDGCQILSVLLGVNIGALAKNILSDKRRVKKMVREGPVGWLCLLLFSFQYLLKIIVVLLEAGSVIFLMILGYYYFFSH